MTEAEWLGTGEPAELIDQLAGATPRKRRLFCVACCQRVITPSHAPVLRNALAVAEEFADANASRSALLSAGRQVRVHRRQSVQGRGSYSLSDLSPEAEAVGALCKPGSGCDPHTILAWISQFKGMGSEADRKEQVAQRVLLRDVFGNPFRPVSFSPEWRTDTVLALARQIYESRDSDVMPILADALQDAGCGIADILDHCGGTKLHVRGCWVVDLVLGKE
jgi:hypothetical protein